MPVQNKHMEIQIWPNNSKFLGTERGQGQAGRMCRILNQALQISFRITVVQNNPIKF
jgi:hypothetical protein